jgi:hypothetical protein
MRPDGGLSAASKPARITARAAGWFRRGRLAAISQSDHQLLEGCSHSEHDRPKNITGNFGIEVLIVPLKPYSWWACSGVLCSTASGVFCSMAASLPVVTTV